MNKHDCSCIENTAGKPGGIFVGWSDGEKFQVAFVALKGYLKTCGLMLLERQFDMRFGRFGRCFRGGCRGGFEAEFDLLLIAEQVAPVAVFIPFGAVGFDGVLDAFAAVAALQIFGAAVLVAAWKRDACSCRITWSATGINIPFSLALHFAHLRNGI